MTRKELEKALKTQLPSDVEIRITSEGKEPDMSWRIAWAVKVGNTKQAFTCSVLMRDITDRIGYASMIVSAIKTRVQQAKEKARRAA